MSFCSANGDQEESARWDGQRAGEDVNGSLTTCIGASRMKKFHLLRVSGTSNGN